MRKDDRRTILAVSPGVRYLGVAVFKGDELVHWAIKVLRTKGMSRRQVAAKARKVVERLMDDYGADVLAIEEPLSKRLRYSPTLRAIIARLEELGRKKARKACIVPARTVRKHLCQGAKPTKMNVEKAIATRYYPWLYRRYAKDRHKDERGHWWKRKYHAPLFDAVALGIYCREKATRKRN